MSVRYCLGIEHDGIASAIDPAAQPIDLAALQGVFRSHIPGSNFEELIGAPSYFWTKKKLTSHILAQMKFDHHEQAAAFHTVVANWFDASPGSSGFGFGPDPYIFPLEAWSTVGAGGAIFGSRNDAELIAGSTKFPDNALGTGVNVVIVDRGLSKSVVQNITDRMARRRGIQKPIHQDVLGWSRYRHTGAARGSSRQPIHPGQIGSEHAHMIARNVLALAPNASIWDAPLLPSDDEPDAPPGPSSASQLFHEIRNAVGSGEVRCWDLKQNEERTVPFGRPVIIVNAWGVMDPEGDEQLENGARGYRDNPNNFLVNDMARLDAKGIDVVFAAGNCGEPCPDGRCGQTDTGPGRSISGMNAHPCVLTVGAVRADGVPLALSAQGPGQLAAAYQAKNDPLFRESYYKPDLCAPSHFREADDAAEYNTGTSAACGFAAGILAALRSNPAGQNLPPAWLRSFLRATARPITGANWDPRLGFGIINGTAALAMIEK